MSDQQAPPEPDVEELTPDDVDELWAFFRRLPEGERTFVREPVTDRSVVAGWLDDDRPLRSVVRLDGELVGYLSLTPGVGWSAHVGQLALVIDPAVRGRGLGHRLARHALHQAVDGGLAKVLVEVPAAHESTIAIFARLGFRPEALLVDHVRDPDGEPSDLIVLANHTREDWELLSTVGLDRTLD